MSGELVRFVLFSNIETLAKRPYFSWYKPPYRTGSRWTT